MSEYESERPRSEQQRLREAEVRDMTAPKSGKPLTDDEANLASSPPAASFTYSTLPAGRPMQGE